MTKIITALVMFLLFGFLSGCSSEVNEANAMNFYWKNDLKKAEETFEDIEKRQVLSDSANMFYAETLRRNGKYEKAEKIANKYIGKYNCNAFALSIKADIWNSQYHAKSGDLDTALKYYKLAIKCDSGFMNANCALWILGKCYKDSSLENNSLRRLDRAASWTQKALAYNKWILNSCPRNSILFVNGDVDTYPSSIMELDSNFRKDVSIININLLKLKWYTDYQCNNINVNFDQTVVNKIVDTVSTKIPLVYSDSVVSAIIDSLYEKRPICFSTTLDKKTYSKYENRIQLIGGVWLLEKRTPIEKYNLIQIEKSLDCIKFGNFIGADIYSKADLSPVRKSTSSDYFMENTILGLGVWCLKMRYREGNNELGDKLQKFVEDFNRNTIKSPQYQIGN